MGGQLCTGMPLPFKYYEINIMYVLYVDLPISVNHTTQLVLNIMAESKKLREHSNEVTGFIMTVTVTSTLQQHGLSFGIRNSAAAKSLAVVHKTSLTPVASLVVKVRFNGPVNYGSKRHTR
jgi:hypothetical protein